MRFLGLTVVCMLILGCSGPTVPKEEKVSVLYKLKPTSDILFVPSQVIPEAGFLTLWETLASNDPTDPPFPTVPPFNPFDASRPRLDILSRGLKYTVGVDTSSLPFGTITLLQVVNRIQLRGLSINDLRLLQSVTYDGGLVVIPQAGPYANNLLDEGHIDIASSAALSISVADFTGVALPFSMTWIFPPSLAPDNNVIHFETELWVTVELAGSVLQEICVPGSFKIEHDVVASVPECD